MVIIDVIYALSYPKGAANNYTKKNYLDTYEWAMNGYKLGRYSKAEILLLAELFHKLAFESPKTSTEELLGNLRISMLESIALDQSLEKVKA